MLPPDLEGTVVLPFLGPANYLYPPPESRDSTVSGTRSTSGASTDGQPRNAGAASTRTRCCPAYPHGRLGGVPELVDHEYRCR
jgi:hypothetical protein